MILIKEKIFKAYDLRGQYPSAINKNFALKFGYFFPYWLRKKGLFSKKKIKIGIGGDVRFSTPILKTALLKGLLAHSLTVYDFGETTTPLFYFGIKKTRSDFGIMITGSHLPANFNGFKIVNRQLLVIGGWELKSILDFFSQKIELKRKGRIKKRNFLREYQKFLLKKINFKRKEINWLRGKKIVINCLGGMTGPILKNLKQKLCFPWFLFNAQPQKYSFKELSQNNKIKLEKEMKKILKREEGELGVIFDGDGDRLLIFDSQGNFIPEDLIGALLAEEVLKKLKNKKKKIVITDERSSKVIKEIVKKNGGRIVFSPVGHRFFKEKMRRFKAIFGSEKSGHYYFKDFFFVDSGIFAFLKILKILAQKRKKIEELIESYRKYFNQPEMDFKVTDPSLILRLIEKKFKKEAKRISHLDGLTMEFPHWWFNLRISQTENCLRLNLEAQSSKEFKKGLEKIKKVISSNV